MISPLKPDNEKSMMCTDKYIGEDSFNLETLEIILCRFFLILVYLSLVEIWKEFIMRENIEQQ